MRKMKRQEVIDVLVSGSLDSLRDDDEELDRILRDGIKGYDELSNEELEDEYEVDFEERIKII